VTSTPTPPSIARISISISSSTPAPPWRTALFTSSETSSASELLSWSESHGAPLCSHARARSGARTPPAMASWSRLLEPLDGGCR
jgi:hypothetical protein